MAGNGASHPTASAPARAIVFAVPPDRSALIEAELRHLFREAPVEEPESAVCIGGVGCPLRILRGSKPWMFAVEFSAATTQWLSELCSEAEAEEVCGKLLWERMEEEMRRSRVVVGAAEAVAWLREVAVDVQGEGFGDEWRERACLDMLTEARRRLCTGKGVDLVDFEDDLARQKSERLRNQVKLGKSKVSFKRRAGRATRRKCSVSEMISHTHGTNDRAANSKTSKENLYLQEKSKKIIKTPKARYSNCRRRRPRIGPLYQADVPIWTGPPDKNLTQSDAKQLSDSKWLGTRLWPLEDDNGKGKNELVVWNPNDNGERKNELVVWNPNLFSHGSYASPGSPMFIRDNIRMARAKLKTKLGGAFNLMGFNNMGETVSNHWNLHEQLAFDSIMRENPVSDGITFLYNALKCFPSRTIQSIVSYYFNVHVLRQMTLQNQLAIEHVDSDDDEWGQQPCEGFLKAPAARHSQSGSSKTPPGDSL